ncbi:MAG: signal peptidase I [Ruminococcaceae bacterium]|nr:signal peptidase I [Oscillospiraceae bacterium]
MKILKKIGSIVIDVLIVIVFIVSLLVVIASITAKRENGQANVFGITANSVQTDSMKGSINEGDLIISKVVTSKNKGDFDLKEGDIVSFYKELEDDTQILITHRIHEVRKAGNTVVITTWGDNRESAPEPDDPITMSDVKSVYLFKIPLLGHFIDFLKTPLGFIICLVVPLLTFICWQAYKLIVLFFKSKQAELDEQAENLKNTQNAKSELSEEEKNAIIAEYLAKQKAQEQKSDDANKENKEKSEEKSDGEKT